MVAGELQQGHLGGVRSVESQYQVGEDLGVHPALVGQVVLKDTGDAPDHLFPVQSVHQLGEGLPIPLKSVQQGIEEEEGGGAGADGVVGEALQVAKQRLDFLFLSSCHPVQLVGEGLE